MENLGVELRSTKEEIQSVEAWQNPVTDMEDDWSLHYPTAKIMEEASIVSSFATTFENVDEIGIGVPDGEKKYYVKEPTCPDSEALLCGEVGVIHNIPTINIDDLMSALPQKSDITAFIEIEALSSEKEKNPPYLVKGKAITTNILVPVKFLLSGVEAMHRVCVSMRYTEELYKDMAVKPCKIHQEWKERPATLPASFNFYLTRECDIYETTGHPTAVIYIQEDAIDDHNEFTFSVVFVCLNSCHRSHGKKLKLIIAVYDHTGKALLSEDQFTIRACRNVKRDHKIKQRYAMKCKYMDKDCEGVLEIIVDIVDQQSLKIRKIDGTSDNPAVRNPKEITMKTTEDEDIILTLIDRLKGDVL